MEKDDVLSGTYAKKRLKLLLLSDRMNCSTDVLECMREGILDVVSRYVQIDNEKAIVYVVQNETEDERDLTPSIVAKIPIIDMNTKSIL